MVPTSAPRSSPEKQSASTPVVEARGVHRILGTGDLTTHILKGVSLRVPPSQYVSIVGASGSGKSTLLYLLGGLDRPSTDPEGIDRSGIHLDGKNLADLDDAALASLRNRLCGFVFQFHYLLKDFTAQENVALPMLKLGRRSKSESFDRAAELLTRLGLGDKTTRRASKLSGGEQQRVALARALANEPAVILADEPTGNLDKRNGEIVAQIFDELAATGQAIIMVTHDTQLAARATRRITMEDGKITQDSNPW